MYTCSVATNIVKNGGHTERQTTALIADVMVGQAFMLGYKVLAFMFLLVDISDR